LRSVDGVLVVDKPRGPTSHDIVAKVRRALGVKRIGHTGTLDPMASGVLVLALGEATKLVPYLSAADKSYEATIALGIETDTLDAEGKEVSRAEVGEETRGAIERIRAGEVPVFLLGALAREGARTRQVPPAYSAIHRGGERAYVRARRGERVDLDEREVVVHGLRLLDAGLDPWPWLAIELEVGKGYYVRAIARDLAASLGTVGHVTALRRTRSGAFTLEDALPIDTPSDELAARIVPTDRAAARALPILELSATAALAARHGRRVSPEELGDCAPGPHAWFAAGGGLVAIGEKRPEGYGQVLRGFAK
jgi:tRNA pseudouridine55 synthase